MSRLIFKILTLASLLLGLPLLGLIIAGAPVEPYLAFPPENGNVRHATFSWIAFILFTVCIAGMLIPFLGRILKVFAQKQGRCKHRPYPWWGWLGVLMGLMFWLLAWTRFSWFKPFQLHTFTPLWLSFIVVMNGLSYRRSGRCLMLNRPLFFLSLFPASAAFWWFFEYLNRFVENWSYVQVPPDGWAYFWRATVSFSTVLAAVLSAQEWITEMEWVRRGFRDWFALELQRPRAWTYLVFAAACLGLLSIGVWPNALFWLLWVSPLLILCSFQVALGEKTLFSGVAAGDWRVVVASAAGALFCGWFWEMWNYWSLAKWTYHVPFVQRFQVFEMPLLGYAGYLPFGLECAVIGDLLERVLREKGYHRSHSTEE